MSEKVYIGIDLGTTNTLAYYIKKNGKPTSIKVDGDKVLPSVIYINTENNNEVIVGKEAYDRGKSDPNNRVMSAKTYMATDRKYLLGNNKEIIYTPTDVAAEVLKKIKGSVTRKLKLAPDDEIWAIITVPAAFSFRQIEETQKAAAMAGINVLSTTPEPVAAVMACINNISSSSTVFVVDIGGGTYDTAAIKFDEKLNPDLISAEGDRLLGGDDFDNAVFEYVRGIFEDEFGIDLSSQDSSGMSYSEYNMLLSKLKDSAKSAKEEITKTGEYEINEEGICTIDGYNNGQPLDFHTKIKEDKFNSICDKIYDKIEKKLDASINILKNEKNVDIKDITNLVLVGGTCYIKKVIEIIERKVGKTAEANADKTTAVAEGAALIADSWTTIGQTIGGVLGQSMGVEVEGGKFSKIIKKNTKYPCSCSKIYTNTRDNQKYVNVNIYAASPDMEDVDDINAHEFYADIELEIDEAKKGEASIEITFTFDNSQRLLVTAKDTKTGNQKSISINKDASAQKRAGGIPMGIDILLDASGSMRGRKMDDAKNACKRLVEEIVDLNSNYIGVTQFDDDVATRCDLSNDADKILHGVYIISAGGGTDMDKGISASANKLNRWNKDGYEKVIFLVTDGAPNYGDRSIDVARELISDKIRIVVIYIGKTSDRGYIIANDIAKANVSGIDANPLFYTAEDMSKLGDIFKRVYADIALA